jgi:hypothetical protein
MNNQHSKTHIKVHKLSLQSLPGTFMPPQKAGEFLLKGAQMTSTGFEFVLIDKPTGERDFILGSELGLLS